MVAAELDAAKGYANIYGADTDTSSLAGIKTPSVPWGSHATNHGKQGREGEREKEERGKKGGERG